MGMKSGIGQALAAHAAIAPAAARPAGGSE